MTGHSIHVPEILPTLHCAGQRHVAEVKSSRNDGVVCLECCIALGLDCRVPLTRRTRLLHMVETVSETRVLLTTVGLFILL